MGDGCGYAVWIGDEGGLDSTSREGVFTIRRAIGLKCRRSDDTPTS